MSIKEIMTRERWATEEAFIRGNTNALDEVFTPDAVFHSPPVLDIKGLEEFKQAITSFCQAFSNIRWNWDEVMSEGNAAAHRYTIRAKHTGTLTAIPVPPTGKELVMKGCVVYHLKNGKIFEFIEYLDWLGLFQQLGAIPPMGQK
jgi:predicted ester cyclase